MINQHYLTRYERFIKAYQYDDLNCKTERHHIIPKCMGGSDEAENLVNLPVRSHLVAHKLLAKAYPNQRPLRDALHFMQITRSTKYPANQREAYSNSRRKQLKGLSNTPQMIGMKKARMDKVEAEGWEAVLGLAWKAAQSEEAKAKRLETCSSPETLKRISKGTKQAISAKSPAWKKIRQLKSVIQARKSTLIRGYRNQGVNRSAVKYTKKTANTVEYIEHTVDCIKRDKAKIELLKLELYLGELI